MNGSQDASPEFARFGDFDLESLFWLEPCLLFGDSLFGHHDDPCFQPLIIDYAEMNLEDHVKQEICALSITGAITKLDVSRKSIAMATKLNMAINLLASDSQAPTDAFALVPYHFNGKQLFVDSIGGEAQMLCCQ